MSNYTKSTNFATKDNLTPGDPLKVVRGTEIDTEFNNIATAVATKTDNSAAAITGGSITGITDLAVADGGTGASTAAGGLNNLLPSQTSNANKYLQTDGTNATWDAVSLSTADITGTLAVANGGTGVTTSTGTTNVVLSNSPTLVTPALGTPSSAVLTNATGLPISTGVSGLGTGVATLLATPSSANLASAITDETGSGSLVFATSPTLVTPILGTPTSGTLTNATGLPISTGVSGLGTGVATFLATPSSANLAAALTDETGSGANVFATSPTLVTPTLGVATATSLQGIIGNVTPAAGTFTTLTGADIVSTNSLDTRRTHPTTTAQLSIANFNAISTGDMVDGFGPQQRFFIKDTAGVDNLIASISAIRDGADTAGAFVFNVGTSGATEGMRLNASGNLGLGVTPSAWGGGYKAYEINAGSVSATTGAGNIIVSNNAYFSGANWIYKATGVATDYVQTGGEHRWRNAASGTAGNAITFTQAMTLDASGNLGIGITSPNSYANYKTLSVFGTNGGEFDMGDGTTTRLNFYTTSSSVVLNAVGAIPLTFGTNGTERARIDSSGNLLVGSTTANAKLYVESTASTAGTFVLVSNGSFTNNVLRLDCSRNTQNSTYNFLECTVPGISNRLFIRDSGNVVNVNNSYGAISDAKLKENIVDASPKLADLMQVKVRNFNMIGETAKQLGVVAQELETVFPSMIDEAPDKDAEGNVLETTTKSVKYSVFVPMLIKALQEQQALIQSLKARLDAANL